MNSEIWKVTNAAVPRVAVQMIPVDSSKRVLVMHRSEAVRSAKNVWSFPSGLQDIGEPWPETAARELHEEYGLELVRVKPIGVYENISGDDYGQPQWHWVILLVGVQVTDVTQAENKEPKKHDKMEFISLDTLAAPGFLDDYKFHKSFMRFFSSNVDGIVSKLHEVSECRTLE